MGKSLLGEINPFPEPGQYGALEGVKMFTKAGVPDAKKDEAARLVHRGRRPDGKVKEWPSRVPQYLTRMRPDILRQHRRLDRRNNWRYSGMYATPEAANRAVKRLARWLSGYPDLPHVACPRHIRANAARAQSQFR
jgi:hypothetical protein